MRYVVAAVVVVAAWALALLLGLAGAWLALPLGVTLLVAGALVASYLLRRARARRAARDIERALNSQAEEYARAVSPEQQAEIRAMQAEFTRAVGALKSSRLGDGSAALYALPWYMIIGPPGAGKTTALRNSGLQFPYLSAAGGGVRGVGGTRNCEWWLTNDAVLLDTAGRYTTGDDDRDEWLAFLDMLRKNRARKPVNGVLVAVSVGELGGAHEEHVAALARRVRERVDEVMGRLQMVVPIYLLFTKCDLIPGFVETFGDLRKAERQQIWGFTVPMAQTQSDARGNFERGFDELTDTLEQRALRRVAQERRREVREKVWAMPAQMRAVRGELAEFVAALFHPNVYQGTPVMRGVYFTSGTQEGRPIDRIVGALAQAFGIRSRDDEGAALAPAPATDAKSYFLHDVFANVVFRDRDLAVRSADEVRRARRARYRVAAAAFAAALLVSGLSLWSWAQNRALVAAAERAAHARHGEARTRAGVAALDALYGPLVELHRHRTERRPASMRLGFYVGDALYDPLRRDYGAVMRRDVAGPVARELLAELNAFAQRYVTPGSQPAAEERGRALEQLKTYLLLTAPPARDEPAFGEPLRAWLAGHLLERWEAMLPEAERGAARPAMAQHAELFVGLLGEQRALGAPRDQAAVAGVRTVLRRVPLATLALDFLINDAEAAGYGMDLTVILGAASPWIHSPARVRGAFTLRGWTERVRPRLDSVLADIANEPWVLGPDYDAAARAQRDEQSRALRAAYFQQYIQEWQAFLDSVRVDTPRDNAQQLVMLQDLTSGFPPPFGRIFQSVATNTELPDDAAGAAAGQLGALAQGAGNGLLARVRNQLGPQGAAALNAAQNVAGVAAGRAARALDRADVAAHFDGFVRFGVTRAPPGGADAGAAAPATAGPLAAYQEQLGFVRNALRTYMDSPAQGSAPLVTALQTARTSVDSLVMSQEVGWRPLLHTLLWPPIDAVTRGSTGSMAQETSRGWCNAVVVPFDRTLRERYPFNPTGHDAALADVAAFFKPEQGILWTYYNAALRADLLHTGDRFDFATRLGHSTSDVYVREALTFLTRAQDVSTVLFPAGAQAPRVDFEVRIRPTPTVASTTFTVDGQSTEYHNGPEQWAAMHWPGEGATHGAALRVRGVSGFDETVQQEGEWGLFRLLEAGAVRGDPASRIFSVSFTLRDQGLDVTLDVRPARSENPFFGVPGRTTRAALLQPMRAEGLMPIPRSLSRDVVACETASGVVPDGGRHRRHRRRRSGASSSEAATSPASGAGTAT